MNRFRIELEQSRPTAFLCVLRVGMCIYIANRRQKEQCCMDFTGVHVLHRFGIQCYSEKLDNIKGELSFEKNYSNETF